MHAVLPCINSWRSDWQWIHPLMMNTEKTSPVQSRITIAYPLSVFPVLPICQIIWMTSWPTPSSRKRPWWIFHTARMGKIYPLNEIFVNPWMKAQLKTTIPCLQWLTNVILIRASSDCGGNWNPVSVTIGMTLTTKLAAQNFLLIATLRILFNVTNSKKYWKIMLVTLNISNFKICSSFYR